jgi:protein involved in polysaccharide export with SLBB domain
LVSVDFGLAAPDEQKFQTLEQNYKIAPMDKLAIKVFKMADLSGDMRWTLPETSRRSADFVDPGGSDGQGYLQGPQPAGGHRYPYTWRDSIQVRVEGRPRAGSRTPRA